VSHRRLFSSADGGTDDVSDADIRARLAGDGFFWLDLHQPGPDEMALLRDVFRFHPLAVEDAEKFGQRAKIEEYDDVVYLVAFGATPAPDADRLVEVHGFFGERFLVTIHHDDAPGLAEAQRRCDVHDELLDHPSAVLYHVLDALTDSFFPVMDELDERIEAIERTIGERPDESVPSQIFALRRRLVNLRRAVGPQRDQMARIASGTVAVPGLTADTRRYFRDVEDHLIRISGIIDGYRDLLGGASDVYQSSVNNRLNLVTKELTAIAGIFLPLSFVTGFFGQNFSWMVEHVGGPGWFFALGVVFQLMVATALVVLFRRRGWL
jgi:magnesium transporter